MRIGIIAEGKEDQAVIANILRAFGIDGSDMELIKPASLDETDKHQMGDKTRGTIQGVRNACISREDFERFFDARMDNKFIVLHVDTAEIEQNFTLNRPNKNENPDYCTELRQRVIDELNELLQNEYNNYLLYAIAIEEIEAWCLAIYQNADTALSANPKQKLLTLLTQRNITKKGCRNDADFYDKISDKFRKMKQLNQYLPHNQSLRDFVDSLTILAQ